MRQLDTNALHAKNCIIFEEEKKEEKGCFIKRQTVIILVHYSINDDKKIVNM